MKALSIQQPWAWLLTNTNPATGEPWKPVENRSWRCRVRGEILVHAGKKIDRDGYRWVRERFPEIPLPPVNELQTGGIVGKVTITGCVREMDNPWFFGDFGILMKGGQPLPFFPCKGMLGFFEVSVPGDMKR